MAITFSELHDKHVGLMQRVRSRPSTRLSDAPLLQEVESLFRELRRAAPGVADTTQRQRLESYIAYWGAYLFEKTGVYYDTSIGSEAVVSVHSPAGTSNSY